MKISSGPLHHSLYRLAGKSRRYAGCDRWWPGQPAYDQDPWYRFIPRRENEAPLYVVDGMFFDNIDFLNPTDIASMSVMKDASAAAIYGVRAANGVVLIETRSGAYNQKTEITYNGYFGFQNPQNIVKMANSQQFTIMARESGSDADESFILNAMQRYGRSRVDPNIPEPNTDWYSEILRVAPIHNHSLDFQAERRKPGILWALTISIRTGS